MPKQPKATAPLIKGYLPVRVTFPSDDPKDPDETFFYIKEHFGGDNKNTIFVANAPFYPDILTNILLRSLLGRFGDIEGITVVPNPRKEHNDSLSWTTKKNLYPSYRGPEVSEGKFAQVTFSSQKEMKKALKRLQEVMMEDVDDEEEYPGLITDQLEIQTLQDETLRKQSGDDRDDDDNDDVVPKKPLTGILAVATRYRQSLEAISSREALLEECNAVMQQYENAEEEDRDARNVAKNQPDDDGFVTVTYSAQNVGSKRELEEGVTTTNRRKGGSKRQRKKKDINGASELVDFYRFQQKETRKKTVQELRKKFEEDLQKVKKMKEERQYRPFA
jgi:ribosomal RNA-processing protein 7